MKKTMTELKGESPTITVIDFNIPLSIMNKTPSQKIIEETKDLNNTIIQLDLRDKYRTLPPTATEYKPSQGPMRYFPIQIICQVTS